VSFDLREECSTRIFWNEYVRLVTTWYRTKANGTFLLQREIENSSAYSHNGIVLFRVFRGSTDTPVFEDFIDEFFFHYFRRWP